MRRHDFAAAWAISDAVLASRDPATRDDPRLAYHLRWVWDGRPLAGRDILVRCYHGLGDTVQFARYLAPLRAVAASVTLEAPPELVALLADIGVDRIAPFDPARPLPPAEVDVEVMELAHALRREPWLCPTPYLRAPYFPSPAPLATNAVALCWRAGEWDARRSVALAALLGVLRGTGLALLSLQRGPAAIEATAPDFLNPGDDDRDVARTAALIACAARVVTVDTLVAHLAGALGAPTTLLLRHDADWRWGVGCRTPWYPSLKLLRQHAPGDWSAPLAALRRESAG